ncbi:MAG: outer membrane protein assembly factor BamB [Gammaproteobacteria bacterium]|jgi:outer membrane protein assembly factor BamB|nr:outer membrane protein assembly factor BamB [Gammaproteobacteria bacterium]
MRSSRRWLAACALLVLAACSKDKDVDQPTKLTDFNATLKAERVWTASVADKGAKPLRLGLGLSIDGNRVYAAGRKGEVAAFDLQSGRTLWRTKTKLALSGGPGSGAGLVVVGSTFGDLVALNSSDGAVRWKTRLNGEVLSAPAVSERLIALRTVDGKLRGISPKDGQELWSQEQQVPRLSLRGTASPVMTGDLVLSGFDNGKVEAVNVNDGSVQWETTISPAHGKTELERMDDVDSTVRVSGSDVYAIGFQGRVSMLALDTGQTWWSHDASSFRAIGLDDSSLYVSTSDGEVVALRRRTGTELWRQKALLHRRLSAAVEADTSIVTADYQGYVHWLDKATGALAARASTGKVRISNTPVVAGNLVLVVNDAGKISAFRMTPMGGKRAATPAEAGTSASPTEPATASPADAAAQGVATETTTPSSGSAVPPAPSAQPPAAQPPQDDQSSVPAPAPGPQPMPPAPTSDEPATAPPPDSGPVPPSPGTGQPPLPSQPTPDPLPPEQKTQPQPPPS